MSTRAEWHDSLLASLAEHADHSRLEVHFSHVEADELRAANPGRIEQLEDRSGSEVSFPLAFHLQQQRDVRLVQVGRDLALDLGGEQGAGRIAPQDTLAAE